MAATAARNSHVTAASTTELTEKRTRKNAEYDIKAKRQSMGR